MKKILKIILKVLVIIILTVALFFGYLTVREYNPADVETLEVMNSGETKAIDADKNISVMTWNIGYSALGKNQDFIMDGGGNTPDADKQQVGEYYDGIVKTADEIGADIRMFQEVDKDSKRSYHNDQRPDLALADSSYALNYSCDFVPFPWPPIGKVQSGIFTTADFTMENADRYSLPCPFTWPVRIANLKRCMMASYFSVDGTDKKLVIVNFHLEAYDSGEGKVAQANQLMGFIQSEYEQGNWVIAGGDWNQLFPGTLEKYPNTHEDLWLPGYIDSIELPEGWQLAFDSESPTCRLLNQPYNPEDTVNTQLYVLDGFIISPNVMLNSVETVDKGFENADHNPVLINIGLDTAQ